MCELEDFCLSTCNFCNVEFQIKPISRAQLVQHLTVKLPSQVESAQQKDMR